MTRGNVVAIPMKKAILLKCKKQMTIEKLRLRPTND